MPSLVYAYFLLIRVLTDLIVVVIVFALYSLAWSLTLREEHRLRVFQNRVLRRIFGPKSDEVIGGWRKLHTEEFHNLYSSPSIIR
jgi:hypothetical protein